MKVVIAIDSFKGSLTSAEAAHATQEGILQVYPEWQTDIIPIADGGEGMLNVMLNAKQGFIQTINAHNPCMEITKAAYGISTDGTTAFIEMATISGLPLVREELRNPMKTTTYGTGELICDALERGCTEFIIGIGGSATNDAGTGMLQAMGVRFLDANGHRLRQGGEILGEIASIDTTHIHPRAKHAHFTVACDVQNPFFGPNGAAHVFARQKGADDSMIALLDKGMRSFAQVLRNETGKDISNLPGSGAAGGMGGGMLALLNAELRSGADLLLDTCHFKERSKEANLIITGEGRMDRQSLMGKITGKILQIGQSQHIPVIALVGRAEDENILQKAGFKGIYPIKPEGMTLEEAMKKEVATRNITQKMAEILRSNSSYLQKIQYL